MTLTICFTSAAGEETATTYRIDLDSPQIGQAHGVFRLSFAFPTQHAIQQTLAPWAGPTGPIAHHRGRSLGPGALRRRCGRQPL